MYLEYVKIIKPEGRQFHSSPPGAKLSTYAAGYYSTIILWASPFALSGIIRNYAGEFPSKIARTLFHPDNISYVGRMIIRPSNESGRSGPLTFMLDVFRTADHAGHIFHTTPAPFASWSEMTFAADRLKTNHVLSTKRSLLRLGLPSCQPITLVAWPILKIFRHKLSPALT